MPLTFNMATQMADVTAHDGTLLGCVPADRQGHLAGERAEQTYTLEGPRAARRIIVRAGGTPNISPIRRRDESWETAVTRHQHQLKLALASQADAHTRAVGA